MKSFEQQIQYVVENNIPATEDIAIQWSTLISGQSSRNATTVVPPLLTTTWDQGWPYNSLCPVDPSGPGGHVWAGCVATAMAQILKYHNYPSQGLGAYSYTWGGYPTTSADFGATTYNWSGMPNSISTEDADVATLIYQTAVSCRSMWGAGSTGVGYSGGHDPMTRAFVNYFRMAFSTIQYVRKMDYTDADWNVLIQNELVNNRPVYYRGDGIGSHGFVCDGVDPANMYHFNFGWGGLYNGYFALSAITPGGNDFTNSQEAIIGIKPNDGSTLVVNTTWSGTITKVTHVAVPDAITLTVTPGATIQFAQDCKLQIFGSLLSTGTSTNYAKFTATNTVTGWDGIKWDNYYMAYEVMADNDSSKLIYTQVEYSKNSGIYCYGYGKVLIDYCKINDNVGMWGGGLSIWTLPIHITNSEFYNNHATIEGGGFFVASTGNLSATISGNDIHDNLSDANGGGVSLSNVNLTLNNNSIHHNQAALGAGIDISSGIPTIINNTFTN
ncbi:MAG TPA: C10 family peptidase, partial [Candidatus Absconditabacterales bacterium]|nr:C10 family peptidase [Candidatus Absconditabacterales bacterium]